MAKYFRKFLFQPAIAETAYTGYGKNKAFQDMATQQIHAFLASCAQTTWLTVGGHGDMSDDDWVRLQCLVYLIFKIGFPRMTVLGSGKIPPLMQKKLQLVKKAWASYSEYRMSIILNDSLLRHIFYAFVDGPGLDAIMADPSVKLQYCISLQNIKQQIIYSMRVNE